MSRATSESQHDGFAPLVARPIAASLVALAVVLSGLLCWRLMPVAPLPQVDFPVIVVTANLSGASPESMAATVATPLERALGSISGVANLSSQSSQGATRIMLEFDLGRDLDEAAREVQAAINVAMGELPAGMRDAPQFDKMDPSQAAILSLALSSENRPPRELYDAASTILAQKLAQIQGVGAVSVNGASLPAVRVELDPSALLYHGIPLDAVSQAVSATNALQPLGDIHGAEQRWRVDTADPLWTATEYRRLVIQQADGAVVRLGDVAQVTDSVEDRYTLGFHNEREAVVIDVSRRVGANMVETIDRIQAALPRLQALLPADMDLVVVSDRSPGIRATIVEAVRALLLAVGLVVLVVWLFLGHWRAALIPSLALPVSIIGSCIVMYYWGFSLNNLSLMALIIAAGLVVDDAIVVVENVSRHRERGLSPLDAAVTGVREVGFTLLAMNLALVFVFVSILFMGGVIERLFREFSITLAAAVLISLVVSVSLTPALCARWLKQVPSAPASSHTDSRPNLSRRLAAGLRDTYADSLDAVMRHPLLTLLVWVGVIAGSVWLYQGLPKETLPEQDTGLIGGFIRGDDGFSYQVMQPKIEAMRQYILADPAVANLTGTAGGDRGLTNGVIQISLKPLAERKVSAQAVVDRLRLNAPQIPGVMLFMRAEQDIRLSPPFSRSDYEVVLRSDSLTALRQWSRTVGAAMEMLPELVDVRADGDEETRQIVLDIDREQAQLYGVDMQTVASVLNNSFSQRQVATLYDDMNQYRVVMELNQRFTQSPEALKQIEVLTSAGNAIPLSAFASWNYGMAGDRIRHDGQFASVGIGYSLAPGVTSVQADQAIEQMLNSVMLPSSVHRAAGSDRMNFEANLDAPWPLFWVIIAVFLVLGVLYESTVHPLTILSTLPPAGIGALLALEISGTSFSLIALLGLFLLIGIVMKNAILMIDFALTLQRQQGLAPAAAIRAAALLRVRPILMANLAGLLGALPLLLGTGEGAELRQPLGLAIFGGLLISQLLTLYTTPVIYFLLETLRQKVLERRVPATDGAQA